MKRFLALCSMLGLLSQVALASGQHPMAGCGLGYLLFGHEGGKNSKSMQILAATTNGTSGNQTFGITSGTSGCTVDGKVAKNVQAEVYAEINYRELSQEMAQGSGEYLNTFAAVLGVSETHRPEFFQLVKERYEVLFPSADTGSVQMLENLMQELAVRPELLG